MPMTPSQYKTRYETLPVDLPTGTVTVAVNKYRLRSKNYNEKVAKAFTDRLSKNGVDTELRIHTESGLVRISPELTRQQAGFVKRTHLDVGDFTIERDGGRDVTTTSNVVTNWNLLARYAFAGKGSPEACQAVLQLASAWGLAPDLQAYADSALGLDCNGFVGNYLWHVKGRRPWTDIGVAKHDHGPDVSMSAFVPNTGNKLMTSWEALDPNTSYVFALVDGTGHVIEAGGGTETAHIVISEPGMRQEVPAANGKPGSFAIRVVESTASHLPGLCETWYTCRSVGKNKVFNLTRGEMSANKEKSFKVVAV